MKRFAVILCAVLLSAALVAVATRPARADHRKAIVEVVNEGYKEGFDIPEEQQGRVDGFIARIGTRYSSRFVGGQLQVDEHFLYSTGKLTRMEGEDKTVSVGLFGHVFVLRDKVLRYAFPESLGKEL